MSNFPKSGQWWQSIYGTRVYIIGVKLNGDVMYQAKNLAGYNGGSDWDDWQHLPDCDSFDWSPWTLEVWPKYYLPTMCSFSRAFYRRDSETETVGVGHTGTEFAWTGGWSEWCDKEYKEITADEASQLFKPPQPEPARTRTVVLRRWIVWNYVGVEYELWRTLKPQDWDHSFDTGEVKAVEVPNET